MKLLVVNLQNPELTHYHDPKTIGSWLLWGRRLSNYPMFLVYPDGSTIPFEYPSAEVGEIQKAVDSIFSLFP